MITSSGTLGIGIGWRPELAGFIAQLDELQFVEVVAESIAPAEPLPRPPTIDKP